MKVTIIIGVLATSLVLVHTEEKTDSLKQLEESIETIHDYEESLTEKLEGILEEIRRKLDDIVKSPWKRVEERPEYVRESAEEIERCIENQKKEITKVLQNITSNINRCIKTALGKGAVVGANIDELIKEIAYKISDIVTNIENCKKKPNIILVKICLFNESCKAKEIIEKTEEDVKAVVGSVTRKVPQIIKDLIRCTESAENSAQAELGIIDNNIPSCGVC